MCLSSLGIILLLIIFIFVIDYPNIFIPIILIIGGVLFIKIKHTQDQLIKKEKEAIEAKDRAWEKYKEIKSQVDFPIETYIVYYKEGDVNILKGNLQMWVQDGMLCFFPFITSIDEIIDMEEKVSLVQILIDDIEHYFLKSDNSTVLNYRKKGKSYSMFFAKNDFFKFKKLIPEKIYCNRDKEITV